MPRAQFNDTRAADQKIEQSKRAVEIETLRAQAEMEPLTLLAAELAGLHRGGPAVLDSYFDGSLGRALARRAEKLLEQGPITPSVEEAVLSILRRRLRSESRAAA